MVNLNQIRAKITDAINNSGMTKAEIARRLGVRPTQISSYTNGRKLPSLDTFANLCAILYLDANEILCIK